MCVRECETVGGSSCAITLSKPRYGRAGTVTVASSLTLQHPECQHQLLGAQGRTGEASQVASEALHGTDLRMEPHPPSAPASVAYLSPVGPHWTGST